MVIGERLRALREEKGYSHLDLEDRSGLCRCEISLIEAGETTPDIATLEKLATVLDSPLHRFFYGGEEPPELLHLPRRITEEDIARGRG